MKKLHALALALALGTAPGIAAVTSSPATAHHDGDVVQNAGVRVSHAWTAEPAAMAHAVEVYLTIENTGREAVRLTGAKTDFSAPAVFQAVVVGTDGAAAVRDVPAVVIQPGQTVTFQPGGLRVVLNDVKRVLGAGRHFHLDLEFAGLGVLEVDVEVERRGTTTRPQS
jgi:copper(I)-binding protein